mmetsp:Transcript_26202/g.82408  ORF Transcript_26202/g.82408 Transcript_26202/m.82408 type:complete len:667 (-) Transcript_26202:133-2133(-)
MDEPLGHSPQNTWQGQEQAGGCLESSLWVTFFEMERRRLQRQACGRQVAHGIWSTTCEVSIFLGLFAYGLATIRMRFLGHKEDSLRYLALPICATIGVVLWALYQSLTTRENVPQVWGKTWGWLLVVWAVWLYEPGADCHFAPGASGFIFGESQVGKAVFTLFLCLECTTFLLWLLVVKLYPVVAQRCRSRIALRLFWRVQPCVPSRPGWYSYRPNGACCSPKRCHFHYDGERDAYGRPHGHGVWRDDSHHGEVLDGEWQSGLPVAPFVSRVFGSGAITMGLRIGYGTARPEGISACHLMPVRPPGAQLRFGVVGVECSVAGGFLAFLPQVSAHEELASAEAAVLDLLGAASSLRRRQHSAYLPLPGPEARPEAAGGCSWELPPGAAAGPSGWSPSPSPASPRVEDSVTALVFVHGFNCPVDWACMRVGQLSSLGKLSPHCLPFVFSWPSGRLLSYHQALQSLPTAAADLPRFLAALRDAGVQEVHLAAHSMGCELIAAALPQLEALLDCTKNLLVPGGAGRAGGQFRISTVTFFNATCPGAAFLAETLPRLLRVCGRLTLYCNRDDVALVGSDLLFGRGKAIGRCTDGIAHESPRVDVVDCTSMDSNVDGVRHSYFDLNAHVVADFQELLRTQCGASRRSRLVRTSMDDQSNVFAFLAPPVFVNW